MTQVLNKYSQYLDDFRTLEQTLDGEPGWLGQLRRQALSRFQQIGFPTVRRGNEEWKYTNVVPVADATFNYPLTAGSDGLKAAQLREITPWNDSWVNLVFVDGHYSEDLSWLSRHLGGAHIANLADAIDTHGDLARQHLAKYAGFQEDGFTAANTSFLRDGAFIHVPDDHSVSTPLHLIFVSTDRGRPTVSHPRTLIVIGKHSKVTVVESYVALSQASYFTNTVVEVAIDEGGKVDHYRYLNESARAFHIGVTRTHQGKDSTFSSTSFAMGAEVARNDLHVFLNEPGSSCYLRGLYLTEGNQHIDNHISIDHVAPHTTSRQYYKGILSGKSQAVYSGKVLVHQDAQKSDAHQSDKNLILSEEAEVDTKPSLEIYADDVQCGHGATTGQVAEDALFYMMARGLDAQTANTLLIYGFASEILDTVQLEPYRLYLDGLFARSLPSFQSGGK